MWGASYTLAHFLDRGLVTPPLFVQTIFGVRGGIGSHAEDLQHMKRTADRLFGDAYLWSVLAAGARQIPLVTAAAIQGARMSASGSRTVSGSGPGSLRTATPSRWRRSCASWASSACAPPRRPRRASCSL